MITILVNGAKREVLAPTDTPLLYVLKNDLELSGPQFGCGLAQCGACSVLLNGKEVRSCITPLGSVGNKEVTTLEGLPARWAKQRALTAEQAAQTLHPVQEAWIAERAPQCGFCQNGMMIKATELLEQVSSPSLAEIKQAFTTGVSPHLCRCGTYTAIIQAVQRAATLRQETADVGRRWVDLAAHLGSPSMRRHISLQDGKKADVGLADETLGRLADYAAKRNTVVNLENDCLISKEPFFLASVIEKANNPFFRGSFCMEFEKRSGDLIAGTKQLVSETMQYLC